MPFFCLCVIVIVTLLMVAFLLRELHQYWLEKYVDGNRCDVRKSSKDAIVAVVGNNKMK